MMGFYPNDPAHYCVQQNTVSALTQRFIFSLFTYKHAAFAEHLNYSIKLLREMGKVFPFELLSLDIQYVSDDVKKESLTYSRYLWNST